MQKTRDFQQKNGYFNQKKEVFLWRYAKNTYLCTAKEKVIKSPNE